MRLFALLLALCGAAACAAPDQPEPGEARRLAGAWDLTLWRGHWLRVLPLGAHVTTGRLVLAPSPGDSLDDSTGRRARCAGCVAGTFRIDSSLDDALGHPPRDSIAIGMVSRGGAVVLDLHVAGPCSDCGNLGLQGHLRDDRVTGRWRQEFLGGGARGRFTLRRAGP